MYVHTCMYAFSPTWEGGKFSQPALTYCDSILFLLCWNPYVDVFYLQVIELLSSCVSIGFFDIALSDISRQALDCHRDSLVQTSK